MDINDDGVELSVRIVGQTGRLTMTKANDRIELEQAIAREEECARLLGPDLVKLAQVSFPKLSLYEYVVATEGSLKALRERKDTAMRFSEEGQDEDSVRAAEEAIAEQLGVSREALAKERTSQGRRA